MQRTLRDPIFCLFCPAHRGILIVVPCMWLILPNYRSLAVDGLNRGGRTRGQEDHTHPHAPPPRKQVQRLESVQTSD